MIFINRQRRSHLECYFLLRAVITKYLESDKNFQDMAIGKSPNEHKSEGKTKIKNRCLIYYLSLNLNNNRLGTVLTRYDKTDHVIWAGFYETIFY